MSGRGEWGFLVGGVGWPCLGSLHLTTVLRPLRNIATIAVFYALPVVQLVITYQTVRRWGLAPLSCGLPVASRGFHLPCRASQPGPLEQA